MTDETEQDHIERVERALERDIEALEDKAVEASKRMAIRVAPAVAAVLVLLLLAWLAGRKLRNRGVGA